MGIGAALATLGTAISAGSVGTAAVAATATTAGVAATGAGGFLAVAGAVGTVAATGLGIAGAVGTIFGSQPGTPQANVGSVSDRDSEKARDRIAADQEELKKRHRAGNNANRIKTSPLGAIVEESDVGLRKLFGGSS